jgi:hypothetical protein
MNKKQVIRINENQLKQIVMESVKRVLNEGKFINHKHLDWNSPYATPEGRAKASERYNNKFSRFEDLPTNRRKPRILMMLKELNIPLETWVSMPIEKRNEIEADYYQKRMADIEDESEMLHQQEREAEIAAQQEFARRSGW